MLKFFEPPERKVLFVCTANVCRSPLAEALLGARLREARLHRRIAVASAGTRVAQPGRPPDPRLRPLLAELGIRLPRSRARQVNALLLAEATDIFVMTSAHRRELEALAGKSFPRVRLLGSLLAEDEAIDDPYFASPATFRAVFERVDCAVTALADELASPGLWQR